MTEYLLEFQNITKTFGGVVALDDVSFGIEKGRVTGLVGENGAGKSTLVKICDGVYQPDEGQLLLEGETITINSPAVAQQIGVSVVHQDIPACGNLTVAENIFLGPDVPGRNGFINRKYMNSRAKELFQELDVSIDPRKKVSKCTAGEKQLMLIAKAIGRKSKLIIMDEPTTALSPNEVEVLYDVFEQIRAEGISIIFISHRLDEVMKVSDRICVLKDGKYIGDLIGEKASEDAICKMMVGRDFKDERSYDKAESSSENIFSVKNLSNKEERLENINFNLRRGEVLGIFGLRGSGRTEMARSIIGDFAADSKELILEGRQIEVNSPKEAFKQGIGYLPEDRDELGLLENMNIMENMCVTEIDNLTKYGFLRKGLMKEIANQYKDRINIKLSSIFQNINELSGGNQQKVLLAKWLLLNPKVLILDEPTKGIDVGTKSEIRKLITRLAEDDMSIIVISSEMIELMAISDRMLVMSEGKISADLEQDDFEEELIMKKAVAEMSL